MITIEIRLDEISVTPKIAATSGEATHVIREVLALMEPLHYEPRLRLRVTGAPTAAASRRPVTDE